MDVGCLITIAVLGISPVLYMLNGWVLSILWKWFIVPFGAPNISIPVAIGIAIVIGFLTKQTESKHCVDDRPKETRTIDAVAQIFAAILYPFVALGIGWIVQSFIV